jgi:hypothetical protein
VHRNEFDTCLTITSWLILDWTDNHSKESGCHKFPVLRVLSEKRINTKSAYKAAQSVIDFGFTSVDVTDVFSSSGILAS